ncbi:MAG: hypothetical protein L6Q59_13430 [Ignavibacteriaceae bacterium]|nr:hypothetical protein [Ignavibacteriaceae bacterium]
MLLYEGSAYTGFCDFSWDASIASLTDAAADQVASVMLNNPDGAVMTCRTASQLAGDCLPENTLIIRTKLI